MPKIEIDRYECKRDLLPRVCMKCGDDSSTRLRREFRWYPGWVWVFFLLGGLILVAILAIILTKKMSLRVPLCEEHRDHWKKRLMWSWISFGIFLLVSALLVLIAPKDSAGLIFFGIMFAFIGFIVVVGIMQQTAIRPQLITDDSITLINVHRNFIDALKEDRRKDVEGDYDDEMDDYDDWERV